MEAVDDYNLHKALALLYQVYFCLCACVCVLSKTYTVIHYKISGPLTNCSVVNHTSIIYFEFILLKKFHRLLYTLILITVFVSLLSIKLKS